MDLTFDIVNSKGDHVMVALSSYDSETLRYFVSDCVDCEIFSLFFYDVTLVRKSGTGYIGYKMLSAITNTLAKFLIENDDAVLCFYCDADTDLKRSHIEVTPQEYRSKLFSRMFDMYLSSHQSTSIVNHRLEIFNQDGTRQYVHFICRTSHLRAISNIEYALLEK